AIGCISGAKTIMADALSRNIPATSMITLNKARIATGDSNPDRTWLANAWGAHVLARIHENAEAPAVMRSKMPDISPLPFSTSKHVFNEMVRYTTAPTNHPYKQAAAADSVGVKIPE